MCWLYIVDKMNVKTEQLKRTDLNIDMSIPFFKFMGKPLIDRFISFEEFYTNEKNKAEFKKENQKNFDDDYKSIVEGILRIDDNVRYSIKGGEFPASIFAKDEVVEAISKLKEEYILNKGFSIMGGIHSCIGIEDNNGKFKISPFILEIIKRNITYKIRRVLDEREAYYNKDMKTVHHPWEEHHFRLTHMRNNDIAETICHNHNPVTATRVWKKTSENELTSFHKRKVYEIIDANSFNYIPYKEKLKNFKEDHLNKHESFFNNSIDNHFLVDIGKTQYRTATKDEIKSLFEKIDTYL